MLAPAFGLRARVCGFCDRRYLRAAVSSTDPRLPSTIRFGIDTITSTDDGHTLCLGQTPIFGKSCRRRFPLRPAPAVHTSWVVEQSGGTMITLRHP